MVFEREEKDPKVNVNTIWNNGVEFIENVSKDRKLRKSHKVRLIKEG